jgi:hypothetical protein
VRSRRRAEMRSSSCSNSCRMAVMLCRRRSDTARPPSAKPKRKTVITSKVETTFVLYVWISYVCGSADPCPSPSGLCSVREGAGREPPARASHHPTACAARGYFARSISARYRGRHKSAKWLHHLGAACEHVPGSEVKGLGMCTVVAQSRACPAPLGPIRFRRDF